jgi:hypothetical protein
MMLSDLVRVKWTSVVMNSTDRFREPGELGVLISYEQAGWSTSASKYAFVMFGDGNIDIINSAGLEQL